MFILLVGASPGCSPQGRADAQFRLGWSHRNGLGVLEDDVEGYKWLTLASSRADRVQRKRCVEIRDFVANQITLAQVADAQQRANEWSGDFEKAEMSLARLGRMR